MTIDLNLLTYAAGLFGVTLDAEAAERFDIYARELLETNKSLNLTAITEPREVVFKHFADSLSLISLLKPETGASMIDVGTGAGFPGLALLAARPDLKMTLLDSTGKKLSFVARTAEMMGLSPSVVHLRAEEAGRLPELRESFDFACARAVASMRELSEYCLPFVKKGGCFAAMKGPKAEQELAEAQRALRVLGGDGGEILHFNLPESGERSVVLVKKISQTSPKYPRPSAKIAKQPLA